MAEPADTEGSASDSATDSSASSCMHDAGGLPPLMFAGCAWCMGDCCCLGGPSRGVVAADDAADAANDVTNGRLLFCCCLSGGGGRGCPDSGGGAPRGCVGVGGTCGRWVSVARETPRSEPGTVAYEDARERGEAAVGEGAGSGSAAAMREHWARARRS